jgi:hypothetical protein
MDENTAVDGEASNISAKNSDPLYQQCRNSIILGGLTSITDILASLLTVPLVPATSVCPAQSAR